MGLLWRLTGIGAAVLVLAGLFWNPTTPISRNYQPWKIGYWVWAGNPPAAADFKPDILYVQVQGSHWPERLPHADRYVVVRRIATGQALTPAFAAATGEIYRTIVESAGSSVNIAGLQIDYDSPTSKLGVYAAFLGQIREALPPDTSLSITALLDWFRSDRSIQEALAEVDEFVPQFYDAGDNREAAGIAEPIDVEKWAPIFNAYGVPYRIGISSFGRMARLRPDSAGNRSVAYFRDTTPLAFARQGSLQRDTHVTKTGELVVKYRIRGFSTHHSELGPGDEVDITFPTEASIRSALAAVRQFGKYCSGAILFRWPNEGETLPFDPDDVGQILLGRQLEAEPRVEARDGKCPSRTCTDVYLRLSGDSSPQAQRIRLQSTKEIQLFLPDDLLQPFLTQSGQLIASVPAYSGLHRVYLGRAFSNTLIQFEVLKP